jgi:Fe-S-cluster containining protein
MIKDIRQLVPSEECLKCDGCCRFQEAKSLWRPKITDEEKKQARPTGVKNVFSASAVDEAGYLQTLPHEGAHICYFFNPHHNTCGVYPFRPFECRLYPFLLHKGNGQQGICAHLSCPYVQKVLGQQVFQEYTAYLKEFFARKETIAFLRKYPSLWTDYSFFIEELQFLFLVDIH